MNEVNFYIYRTDEQLFEKRAFYTEKLYVAGRSLLDYLFKINFGSFDDFEDIHNDIFDLFHEISEYQNFILKIDDVLISRYIDLKNK